MKLIVGLGNPGLLYKNTRHNIGFQVVDAVASLYNFKINKSKFGGLYFQINIDGEEVIFLKPQKYINLSGEIVKKYKDYFNININDILIVHDDLDIPLGKYKLKSSGSSAGHNGLKDIEKNLNTEDYKRLKIGISNDKNINTKNYVLGKFQKSEKLEIERVIKETSNIIKDYLNMSFVDLMNKYNKK
jgi:PTH1 family peptidyl-tRNA hydrolase